MTSSYKEERLFNVYQFGFREEHFIKDQTHRIVDLNEEKNYGGKEECSVLFLDIVQAFDKFWRKGHINKVEQVL